MKMENVIVAPHNAKVKSIAVNIGDAVDKGQTLVEFE
jgi:biotin carboxyl carrier protein